jgi:amino acid adenylation domain-containing protein
VAGDGRLLQDYLRVAADRDGDAIALVLGQQSLSYAEVEVLSNQLAWRLLDAGAARGERVCLLTGKAPATIVAMLAVLKAGGAYVPLDDSGPVNRTAQIVTTTAPVAVIGLDATAGRLAELIALGALAPHTAVICLDAEPSSTAMAGPKFGPGAIAAAPAEPPPIRADSADPAYIIFTSGSTGRPKGVVVSHASVRAFADWAVPYFGIAAGERLSGHPPLHFDLSVLDVYTALKAGAELHLMPPQTLLPRQLAEFIDSSALDQLNCVPSVLTYLSRGGAIPEGGFRSLKRVMWCGEVLPTPVLIDWMRRVPQARFTNMYGPTEATCASSFHPLITVPDDERQAIPIGTACTGEELVILDVDGTAEPVDEVGELCIGGAGLSLGYWREPALTADAFIPDPRPGHQGERLYQTGDLARRDAQGLFHFVGRADTQIKSRGYRIELGEVETALSGLPAVAECAVVGVPTDGFEGTVICCAVVPKDGLQPTPAQLRTALAGELPAYMLPGRWELMAALPKNRNGKVDRRLIQARFADPATGG